MCLGLVAFGASAQEKGDMAAGINLGVAPCLESGVKVTNFGVGAKFQYNISNPIRLEAAFDYGFKSKGLDVMTVGVNAHYIFKLNDKFNIYPIIGLGYARISGVYKVEVFFSQQALLQCRSWCRIQSQRQIRCRP